MDFTGTLNVYYAGFNPSDINAQATTQWGQICFEGVDFRTTSKYWVPQKSFLLLLTGWWSGLALEWTFEGSK